MFVTADSSFKSLYQDALAVIRSLREYNVPKFKTTFYYKKIKLDKISKAILPTALRSTHALCEIVGDGNCLFRSLSMSLYGNESYHIELRVRCLLEMIFNMQKFLDEKYLNGKDSLQWLALLSTSGSSNINCEEVLIKEIRRCCILGSWTSGWFIYGIANALNVKIQQIYPEVDS